MKLGSDLHIPRRVKLSGGRALAYTVPKGVLVAGMGGSAISGDLLRDALGQKLTIPFFVCRDYVLPSFVGQDFLVLSSSYSGNTEETLSAYLSALERGCMVISLSSGGKLEEFSRKLGIPHLHLPSSMVPRLALPFMLIPMLTVLNRLGVISSADDDVRRAGEILGEVLNHNSIKIPLPQNYAKKLAVELSGYVPIIYGWRYLSSAAYRLMTDLQENSKVPAKSAIFPELNHNEALGWQAGKNVTKLFAVLLLRDRKEPTEIAVRIEATKNLVLRDRAGKVLEMWTDGESYLEKLLSTVYKGLIVSYYLALMNKVDPWRTKGIDLLKKELEIKLQMANAISRKVEQLMP